MNLTWIFLIMCLYFGSVKNQKMEYLELIESFNAMKLIKGLRDQNPNSSCGVHISEFLKDLKFSKSYANIMLDANAGMPNGLLKGNVDNLGHFDECVEVEHPKKLFIGQHCLLNIHLVSNGSRGRSIQSIIRPNQENDNLGRFYGKLWNVRYGICLPSTCSVSEIVNGLNAFFISTSSKDEALSVALEDDYCNTKISRELSSYDWFGIHILIGFCALALISTCYELYHRILLVDTAKPHLLLTSFSILKNGRSLFQVREKGGQLKVLQGIRVISMLWVISRHVFANAWTNSAAVNLFDVKKITRGYTIMAQGNAGNETFFFISGLLASVVFFRDIKKNGYYDVPLKYIHRYIRVMPSYVFMVLITLNVLFYSGDGPLWFWCQKRNYENCWSHWWSGLLNIQHFINPPLQCLPETWYLSLDMQLHWLSPLILYPLHFWNKRGKCFIAFVLWVWISICFAVPYIYDLRSKLLPANTAFWERPGEIFILYVRASPFLIGIATGYIIDKNLIKLNKLQIIIGWFTTTGLFYYSLYWTLGSYSKFAVTFYVVFQKVAWGFGLAWIVLACERGFGGPINNFLSWDIFEILGKLSYSVFYLHNVVQKYRLGIRRTNSYTDRFGMMYDFLGDAIFAILLAIPFTLIFEMPFANLERYLLKDVKIFRYPREKYKNPKD